jgi:hypothetical protein
MIPPSLVVQSASNAKKGPSASKATPPGSPIIDGATVKLPEIGEGDPFVRVVKALAMYD